MNSYTAALDEIEVDEEALYTPSSEISNVLKVKRIHMYKRDVDLYHEWPSFWTLFACFLAEIDQETIEAIRAEIIAGE